MRQELWCRWYSRRAHLILRSAGSANGPGDRIVCEASDFGAAVKLLSRIRVVGIGYIDMMCIVKVGVERHTHEAVLAC